MGILGNGKADWGFAMTDIGEWLRRTGAEEPARETERKLLQTGPCGEIPRKEPSVCRVCGRVGRRFFPKACNGPNPICGREVT
jgi:hypothetical protein